MTKIIKSAVSEMTSKSEHHHQAFKTDHDHPIYVICNVLPLITFIFPHLYEIEVSILSENIPVG